MKRLNNQPNKLLYNISNQVSSWRNVMTFYKNDLMLNSLFSKENLSNQKRRNLYFTYNKLPDGNKLETIFHKISTKAKTL
jgi:hypothetical protein